MLAVAAGVAFGAGLWLLLSGLAPAPVPLARALDRLARPQPGGVRPSVASAQDDRADVDVRIGAWLRRNTNIDRAMEALRTDLRILHRSPDREAAQLAVYGLIGLLWVPLVATGAALLGIRLPMVVPVWMAIAGAVVAVVVPFRRLRTEAAEARAAFEHALSAFCDVAAMAMSAGQEVHTALFEAAASGTTWPFAEIDEALHTGFLAGQRPWESLTALGHELGVDDLVDLGGTIGLAEQEGAPVVDTLASKARSIRERLVAGIERQAAAATERMAIPGAMLMIGFLWFITFPAIHLILQEA